MTVRAGWVFPVFIGVAQALATPAVCAERAIDPMGDPTGDSAIDSTGDSAGDSTGDSAREATEESAGGTASHRFHWSATIGWFGALSGPLGHGPAAHIELLPGGAFGRFGIGLYYRGDRTVRHGAYLAGLVYEAGAARPKLVMTLHAAVGYDAAHDLPIVGGGWRISLAVSGPIVVSTNLTGQLFLDGVNSRLGIGVGLTAGLAL